MTPTLLGRWQTRILLYVLVGLPVTLVVAFWAAGWGWPPSQNPFWFLTTILAIGLLLDIVYQWIQQFRWDADWPFAFFVFFSFVEFGIVFGLMRLDVLPYLPACTLARINPQTQQVVCDQYTVPFSIAITHFLLVFIPSFLGVLGFLQIFLVRWRFKGAELGRMPIRD